MTALTDLANECAYDFGAMVARLDKDDDFVGVGADLLPSTLVGAYLQGAFPWYDDEPIYWYSPSVRCVITPSEFRPKKSLQRTAKKSPWTLSTNLAFDEVITACANTRPNATWINADMIHAYQHLYKLGIAKSVEVWSGKPQHSELIGGLYGLQLGQIFCGESMFHTQTDASKIAFWGLMILCQRVGIHLVDCQLENAHLMSLGAKLMPREAFLNVLPNMTKPCQPLDAPPFMVADYDS